MNRYLILFTLVCASAMGQQMREGTIVDQETRQPVPFASIGIVGTSKGTSSNLNGQFSLAITGTVEIKITCVGYESKTISSDSNLENILLKPKVTELDNLIIYKNTVNPRKVVRKAFAAISENYDQKDFMQKFFYRHYCKDDEVYGRLIESSLDVWKYNGYRTQRKDGGEKEEIRVTQLRRSLDNTLAAQGHTPISIKSILQADLVGYQAREKSLHVNMFEEVSDLKVDFENYNFTFGGATTYDGQEVYIIMYASAVDSLLTTSGYQDAPTESGSLYITTDSYAIVKAEDVKKDGINTFHSIAYYKKHDGKYYPYHLVRQGESNFPDKTSHAFNIELMSVEIQHGVEWKFTGKEPTKEELLKIPFDSVFWSRSAVLKTTPLEEEIIRDLGGGRSLNEQFLRYQQYHWCTTNGGEKGDEKFNVFKTYNKNKHIIYLGFWESNCGLCLKELEQVKRLQKLYRKYISVVLISLDKDEERWQQMMAKYNLFSDGIVNYRIAESSPLVKEFKLKQLPSYALYAKPGVMYDAHAKHPTDPGLEGDFKLLIEK